MPEGQKGTSPLFRLFVRPSVRMFVLSSHQNLPKLNLERRFLMTL